MILLNFQHFLIFLKFPSLWPIISPNHFIRMVSVVMNKWRNRRKFMVLGRKNKKSLTPRARWNPTCDPARAGRRMVFDHLQLL